MQFPGFVIDRFVQTKMTKVRQQVAECQTVIDDIRQTAVVEGGLLRGLLKGLGKVLCRRVVKGSCEGGHWFFKQNKVKCRKGMI